MRGATQRRRHVYLTADISIHAPREGCDGGRGPVLLREYVISIHAPREGCDPLERRRIAGQRISIHAPREGCDDGQRPALAEDRISIHAPREGCDDPRL